jgi:hypothetical protein
VKAYGQMEKRKNLQKRNKQPIMRAGTAVVETAVLLPLIVLFVFTSLDLADRIFFKQSLTIAAYEGARAATRPGGTVQAAQQRISEVLSSRDILSETVVVDPPVTPATPRGTPVSVTVKAISVPRAINPLRFLQSQEIQQTVHMVRL